MMDQQEILNCAVSQLLIINSNVCWDLVVEHSGILLVGVRLVNIISSNVPTERKCANLCNSFTSHNGEVEVFLNFADTEVLSSMISEYFNLFINEKII